MRIAESQLRRLIRETLISEGTSTILPSDISPDDIVELFSVVVKSKVSDLPSPEAIAKIESEHLPKVSDPREREIIELGIRCIREYKPGINVMGMIPSRVVRKALGKLRGATELESLDGLMYGPLWGHEIRTFLLLFRQAVQWASIDLRDGNYGDKPSGVRTYPLHWLDSDAFPSTGKFKEAVETFRLLQFWMTNDFSTLPLQMRKNLANMATDEVGLRQATELVKSLGY